jgi:plastocyanin
MLRVGIATAIAAVVAALAVAPAADAALAEVKIEATKFDPAVLVVPPGAKVTWVNADSRQRSLRGDVDSPPIAAGGKFELRFRRPGIFEYADSGNPLIVGTVIVALGGGGGRVTIRLTPR